MNASASSGRRIGWVWPLVVSFALHGLLVFSFSIMPEVEPVASAPVIAEWEAPDREMDYVVMDICESAAPIQPRVVGLPPTLAAPAIPPELASSAAGHVGESAPQGGTGSAADASPADSRAEQSAGTANPSVAGCANETGATWFFRVPAVAHSVVYVIDRSGSMGLGGRLGLAQRELEASLLLLPESVRFQVIGYNRRADFLPSADGAGLFAATAANKQIAIQWLKSLVAEGATDHVVALKQALLLAPDVIFFLTDADDLKPEQVQALTQLNHGRTTINTIELTPTHSDRQLTPLQQLAISNHGQYQAAGSDR